MALIANGSAHGASPRLELLPSGLIPLLALFERLAFLGYSFDLAKWELFVNGGLLRGVPAIPSNDCQIPLALETRVRFILDTERRLAPGAGIDKLAFYLVVGGLDGVPVHLVLDYVHSSIDKFFVAGDGMVRRLPDKPARLGPSGERRLADEIARAVVREYPPAAGPSLTAYQKLLAAAFCLYFRNNWNNRRPSPQRRWTRIITPEFLDYQSLPVKTIAGLESAASGAPISYMDPAADKEDMLARLRAEAEANPTDLLQAVKDAATIITAAAPRFPELHDGAIIRDRKVAFAAWVLSLMLPLLAAGLFRVTINTRADKYANLVPNQKETGLESILRTVLLYWHT